MAIKMMQVRVMLTVSIPVRDEDEDTQDDIEDQLKDWYKETDHRPLSNASNVLDVDTEVTGFSDPDPT